VKIDKMKKKAYLMQPKHKLYEIVYDITMSNTKWCWVAALFHMCLTVWVIVISQYSLWLKN